MENKQYPPRGGPPLVYRCRGIPGWRAGTRVFHHGYPLRGPTAHFNIILARIEEDVGPPGWLLPNLEGLGNLQGLKNNCKAREPAWPSAGVQSHYPGSIAIGIAVGLSQRTEKAHTRTGLQPHSAMRLKPEELVCSSVARQLKQTAMKEKQTAMICKNYQPGSIAVGFSQRIKDTCKEEGLQPHLTMRLKLEELVCFIVTRQLPACRTGRKQTAIKQPAMKEKEIAMDNLDGSPNLQGFGNLEGLRRGLKNCSRAREPGSDPPETVCRSGTGTERARDGTTNVVSSNPAGLHVYSQPVSRENSTPAGVVQPVVSYCFYKHLIPACSADRPLESDGGTKLYIRAGTDLGSRNAATRRPVHPPEWERYAKKRVKCRMMNNEYRMMNEESGNVDSGSRRSEVGGRKSEDGRQRTEVGSWKHEVGTRNPEPATRSVELGTWNSERGTRNPEPGTWNSKPGTRNSKP